MVIDSKRRPERRLPGIDWQNAAAGALFWTIALAAVTLLLSVYRDALDEAHKILAYLLLVLFASARHGRVVGLAIAALAFLAFNFFLLPPYNTLALADPLNWSVLLGFLLTGMVAAQLFHRTQRALAIAESRVRDVERLTALAAESLSAPTARDAVLALARVIRKELSVRWVEVVSLDGPTSDPAVIARSPESGEPLDPQLVRYAVQEGRLVARLTNGTSHVALPGEDLASLLLETAAYALVIVPLRIRDRTIGALGIADPEGLRIDHARVGFDEALFHYAALAVERVRLATEVEQVVALREAERLKDALLASVSHDLRTPLTTIRALASEMRTGEDERAVIIEEEADRLNRLVADMLDLSRIRAGALPLDPQIVAAEDLVGAALQRLASVPGSDRIQVALPSDGTLPVARLDFVQSLRVLCNLLENALRYGAGEPVQLDIATEENELVLRVADRGPGVAEGDRERIFEPFFQGGTGNHRGGTGLGLAIARSLAEAQGGSVSHVPRPGGGSVFELRLPAARLWE